MKLTIFKQRLMNIRRKNGLILILVIFSGIFFNFTFINLQSQDYLNPNVRSSGIWATLDLYPASFNNTRLSHNTLITIQGRLYNRITGDNKSGYNIAIEIDDVVDMGFTDITVNGIFQIDYVVDTSLDIYTSHKIEAIVSDSTPDTVEYRTFYSIDVSTNSYFDIIGPSTPQLIGDFYDPNGFLRTEDNNVIPFASINYRWYNGPVMIETNFVSTDATGLIQNIPIPDIGIDNLDLLLSYNSLPEIEYSEVLLSNPMIFSNISCIWDLPTIIRASTDLIIAGKLISRTNPSLVLNNKLIQIFYNGTLIREVQTDNNGDFSITYGIPAWTGITHIIILMPNSLGKTLLTTHYIDIQAQPNPVNPGVQAPPLLMFFSIFLPVLGCVVGVISFYGYRYYKKQEKASKIINLPLEDKINNLKILKESGRLEESLSYLFNAIYMDLINAKYGRKRKDNETIRDFAIVSVKDLSLSPTSVYPFIQKVEEIVYARPYQIKEHDFYNTIELFSPIYFELTGYNFILNF